jgi:hypothetical protein
VLRNRHQGSAFCSSQRCLTAAFLFSPQLLGAGQATRDQEDQPPINEERCRHAIMMTNKEIRQKMEGKPTLLQARRAYNHHANTMITSQQLASMAVVPLAEEFLMELGRPVSYETARRVLGAFSTLTGRQYTLNDVDVTLKSYTGVARKERNFAV